MNEVGRKRASGEVSEIRLYGDQTIEKETKEQDSETKDGSGSL